MENSFENVKAPEPLNLKKSRFTINETAVAVVTFIVLNLLFSWVISGFNIKSLSGTVWYYGLQVVVEALFVLAAFIVSKVSNLSFVSDTGMKNKVSLKMAGWCFLVSFVSILFFGNLTSVFLDFLTLLGYKSILGNIEIETFGQYLGMFVSTCVAAAFCEEVLFRGVILSGFRKYGSRTAIFASAAIFMIMHGNAEQTIHQFIVGIIVGVVFYKTGNLWIGVLIHFFNNFIPVTQAYLIQGVFADSAEVAAATETVAPASGFGSLMIGLFFAVLYAWVGYFIVKWIFSKIFEENRKLNGEYEQATQKTAVVIDGQETTVDMSIDGAPVETVNQTEEGKEIIKVEPMSRGTLFMFIISGIYLIGNWLMYAIYGFMI